MDESKKEREKKREVYYQRGRKGLSGFLLRERSKSLLLTLLLFFSCPDPKKKRNDAIYAVINTLKLFLPFQKKKTKFYENSHFGKKKK